MGVSRYCCDRFREIIESLALSPISENSSKSCETILVPKVVLLLDSSDGQVSKSGRVGDNSLSGINVFIPGTDLLHVRKDARLAELQLRSIVDCSLEYILALSCSG